MEIIAIIISALCLILLAVLVFKKKENNVNPVIEAVQQLLQRELKDNRSELSVSLKENREELSNGLDKLTQKLRITSYNVCYTKLLRPKRSFR